MDLSIDLAQNEGEWESILSMSSYPTLFHTWKWLKIVEKHTKHRLFPLILRDGTNPVGIAPFFLQKKMHLNLFLSPPSTVSMLCLGPAIVGYDTMKQGRREYVHFEIIKAISRHIFEELGGQYIRIRTSPGGLDSRPYVWNHYQVKPYYTMILDIGRELTDIWEGFDKEPRRQIEKAQKKGVTVHQGTIDDIDFIHTSLARRFHDQGLSSNIEKEFLLDVFHSFSPENLNIFVSRYQNEVIGGILILHYKNRAHFWIGSTKTIIKGIYPNDLLHWEVIKWARESGLWEYELMDSGDNRQLSTYKSKFNPRLSIFYSMDRYSGYPVYLFEKLYRKMR